MKNDSGNVLIYILIAVALLAALSYAVARMGHSSGLTEFSNERDGLMASELIEYGTVMGNAIAQLRLRGYPDTEISFANDIDTDYTNPNCVESGCEIFNPAGGALHYLEPKAEWLDDSQSAQAHYGELYITGSSNVEDVGTGDDDLILFVPYIRKSLCEAINTKLGILPSSDDVPSETDGPFVTGDEFIGTYGSAADQKISGDGTTGETEILHNQSAGCTEGSGGASIPPAGSYHFYQVLISR